MIFLSFGSESDGDYEPQCALSSWDNADDAEDDDDDEMAIMTNDKILYRDVQQTTRLNQMKHRSYS